jgi:hypothetical protein
MFLCTCSMPQSLHLCLFVPGERKHSIFDGVSTRWDTVDSFQNSIIFADDLFHKQNLIHWAGQDGDCMYPYLHTWILLILATRNISVFWGCSDLSFWVITQSSWLQDRVPKATLKYVFFVVIGKISIPTCYSYFKWKWVIGSCFLCSPPPSSNF